MSNAQRHVSAIGRCLGCTHMARLEGGVCANCLAHPRDGRRWALLRHRARTDTVFARAIYDRLKDVESRTRFRTMFGDPYGRVFTQPTLVEDEHER